MIESVAEHEEGGVTLRAIHPHFCGRPSCRGLSIVATVARFGEDRWWVAGGIARQPDTDIGELLEDFIDRPELLDLIERGCACFGAPWCELTPAVLRAQWTMLQGAPQWAYVELFSFSADELFELRRWICDDQGGFFEGLQAIHTYRHSVDRRVAALYEWDGDE